MHRVAVIAGSILLVVACGKAGGAAVGTGPSPTPSPSVVATPSPSSRPSPLPVASSYGLLLVDGTLEMITPKGQIGARASLAAPSVRSCTQGVPAVLQPPVSATSDQVFFRNGDTRIRFLAPDGRTGDATTVPGNSTTISFFSVSPDDQRIAVLVEDMSSSNSIGLQLYVEDLHGGGHHTVIYATSTPKDESGLTLWPMGWHQGLLVLALVTPCASSTAGGLGPSAYQVIDPTTAIQRASSRRQRCIASWWPSPAGVLCVDLSAPEASVYDWSGNVTATIPTSIDWVQSGLSPSGLGTFFSGGQRFTYVIGAAVESHFDGHGACLWIDENHLLAPDAVLTAPTGIVTSLPADGVCAGRFPGGL